MKDYRVSYFKVYSVIKDFRSKRKEKKKDTEI